MGSVGFHRWTRVIVPAPPPFLVSGMEQVIAVMVVIVLVGLLADKALFAPRERFLHRRWGTGAKAG